nr:MAG TPA: hypothetical protein [Caudoviricetes sp.]
MSRLRLRAESLSLMTLSTVTGSVEPKARTSCRSSGANVSAWDRCVQLRILVSRFSVCPVTYSGSALRGESEIRMMRPRLQSKAMCVVGRPYVSNMPLKRRGIRGSLLTASVISTTENVSGQLNIVFHLLDGADGKAQVMQSLHGFIFFDHAAVEKQLVLVDDGVAAQHGHFLGGIGIGGSLDQHGLGIAQGAISFLEGGIIAVRITGQYRPEAQITARSGQHDLLAAVTGVHFMDDELGKTETELITMGSNFAHGALLFGNFGATPFSILHQFALALGGGRFRSGRKRLCALPLQGVEDGGLAVLRFRRGLLDGWGLRHELTETGQLLCGQAQFFRLGHERAYGFGLFLAAHRFHGVQGILNAIVAGRIPAFFKQCLKQFRGLGGQTVARHGLRGGIRTVIGHRYLQKPVDGLILVPDNGGHEAKLLRGLGEQDLCLCPRGVLADAHVLGHVSLKNSMQGVHALLEIGRLFRGQLLHGVARRFPLAAGDVGDGDPHLVEIAADVTHLGNDAHTAHLGSSRGVDTACGRGQPVGGGSGHPVGIGRHGLVVDAGDVVRQLLDPGGHAARRVEGEQDAPDALILTGLIQGLPDAVLPHISPPALLAGDHAGDADDGHTTPQAETPGLLPGRNGHPPRGHAGLDVAQHLLGELGGQSPQAIRRRHQSSPWCSCHCRRCGVRAWRPLPARSSPTQEGTAALFAAGGLPAGAFPSPPRSHRHAAPTPRCTS